MRKEAYDKILREGIEKLKGNTDKKAIKLTEAFNKVLACENPEELNQYYTNMDEFFGANTTDITFISPHYLLTKKSHTCTGENCSVQ